MTTQLISITPNAEQIIAYCARVSSDNQDNPNITKLLRYCLKHKHWSPFEHASMTIQIKTNRAIARQILRHRSFCFQEFSQRYNTNLKFDFIKPRNQAETNRQSSTDDCTTEALDYFRKASTELEHLSSHHYQRCIDLGVARESTRFLLPEFTMSKMYMTGNIRSWIHYVDLRTQEDTQLEHRLIAQEIKLILTEQMPVLEEILWQQ
jgi:thymidylate synthase (FAD)